MESIHAHPAVKVGGRRLSLSARHKPHMHSESSPVEPAPAKAVDDSIVDYPRPTRPAPDEQDREVHHQDDIPKKEKKQRHGQNEHKLQESVHHKVEATRPTRDGHLDQKGFGAGGRIAQPFGKMGV